MPLDDARVDALIALIRDTFRVRADQDPIYVDIHGHLDRIAARQHQIIFGRRGSGKSCLLVHYHRQGAKKYKNLSVYLLADEVKTLPYPDLLIRMLLTVFEGVAAAHRNPLYRLKRPGRVLRDHIANLRRLLDTPLQSKVEEARATSDDSGFDASVTAPHLRVGGGAARRRSMERTSQFVERKQEHLERHLPDLKASLTASLKRSGYSQATILIDDFYLVPLRLQPDVIDYLHRLLRDTPLYLKIGTIRHRTRLSTRRNGATIGVELYQDVEEINLDQTIDDVEATRDYLATMLDTLGRRVKLSSASSELLSPDGLLHLTLASGGVPRDFLNIFVNAVEAARARGTLRWLTPTTVYKGAGRLTYRTKLTQLRSDFGEEDSLPVEKVFTDLTGFCLKEKRKTAFLISQDDAGSYPEEHELIQQLMDAKLVHVIEPDTSAASGRPGRYEAYTLDFALFMEPRLRNIEHAEFWRIDEDRRRVGLREAPTYPLERARAAVEAEGRPDTESVPEDVEAIVGVEPEPIEDDE